MDVSGPASVVEAAFGVRLMHFKDKTGRDIYAPDAEPSVPANIASHLVGVIGLDNAAQWQPQVRLGKRLPPVFRATAPGGGDGGGSGGSGGTGGGSTSSIPTTSNAIAGSSALPGPPLSGPNGDLAPSDIRTAYNLNSIPNNVSGQVVALVELNGFNPSDVQAYEDRFYLPHIPIQIISIDGSTNTVDYTNPVSNSPFEPLLDIDMVAAVAPGIRLIRIYQGVYGPSNQSNVTTNLLHVYNRLCSDANLQTGISFATTENSISSSMKQSENNAFQTGALTGNTIFAASGDHGTYGGVANDPATQPFVCGVGGTTLVTDQYANYVSETTWAQTIQGVNYSSGGGISQYWAIPSWQKPVVSNGSGASTSNRNVPDVSLNAYGDYAVYSAYYGGWNSVLGTSAGTPIWAAFTALINGRLNSHATGPVGMITRYLYPIAQSSRYSTDFHDVADHSNNGTYYAVPGYDLVTGLGSFNGTNLFADIVAANGG